MTNTMMTASIYRLFFADAYANVKARNAAYEAEVREWYTTGLGASPDWVEAGTQDWFDFESGDDPSRLINLGGRGYRFPSCIHGSSLITDYDNICGGCEDGLSDIEIARYDARTKWNEFAQAWDWYKDMPTFVSHDMRNDLGKWVIGLLPSK